MYTIPTSCLIASRCPGKQLLNPKDIGGDEDCLTVNVFRPHGAQGKLPVAVYVHGGAYNRGTGECKSLQSPPLCTAKYAASGHNTASMVGWSDEPFVAVSFNYRYVYQPFPNPTRSQLTEHQYRRPRLSPLDTDRQRRHPQSRPARPNPSSPMGPRQHRAF